MADIQVEDRAIVVDAEVKGHKDFAATDDQPDWSFSPIAQAGETSGQGPESALPAYVTTFQIDLTALQITAEKAVT
jgi:hypothetical protein